MVPHPHFCLFVYSIYIFPANVPSQNQTILSSVMHSVDPFGFLANTGSHSYPSIHHLVQTHFYSLYIELQSCMVSMNDRLNIPFHSMLLVFYIGCTIIVQSLAYLANFLSLSNG